MALRNPAALLATFTYSGLLCLAPAARTCIAHTLPATPDVINLSPVVFSANASLHPWAAGVESWNATSIVFVNSINFGLAAQLHAAVVHSIQM